MFSGVSHSGWATSASQQNTADKVPGSESVPRKSAQSTDRNTVDGSDINHRKTTISTTTVECNQSAAPTWLHYLNDVKTIQDQLLKLTTPGEVVPPLLRGVPIGAKRPLLNHFPILRRHWNVADILDPGSPAAARFAAVCRGSCANRSGDSLDVVRIVEREFIWYQLVQPMSRTKLANLLYKHVDKLLTRLFSESKPLHSTLETTASVCRFLVEHGFHPAITHRIASPSARHRYIMMIPARDGFFLISYYSPNSRRYVSDHDVVALGHSGITCADFITRYARTFRAGLTNMLQLTVHCELTQTCLSDALTGLLECYDAEPANEVLSQLTFLASNEVQQKIADLDIHELELIKLMLSSPVSSEEDDDDDEVND